MARMKAHCRADPQREIPRIGPAEAALIQRDIEHLLDDSQAFLSNLRSTGIAELLRRLDDKMLRLAIQPDDSGERARARLMSGIVPALCAEATTQMARVEEFVRITNVMLPCLLLELGRRKNHIQVEFPAEPSSPAARFKISLGGSTSHTLSAQQVVDLVATVGEELVGVCYFGDEQNRRRIEKVLADRQARFPKNMA